MLAQVFTVSADRATAAWLADDGSIQVVDVASGKRLRRFGTHWETGTGWETLPWLALSPQGRHLAMLDPRDSILRVWDVSTGKVFWESIRKRPSPDTPETACLAFSLDGKMLAIGGQGCGDNVELWEVATGKRRSTVGGHAAPVTALAFSPDGRFLASGSADTMILVWDVWGLRDR